MNFPSNDLTFACHRPSCVLILPRRGGHWLLAPIKHGAVRVMLHVSLVNSSVPAHHNGSCLFGRLFPDWSFARMSDPSSVLFSHQRTQSNSAAVGSGGRVARHVSTRFAFPTFHKLRVGCSQAGLLAVFETRWYGSWWPSPQHPSGLVSWFPARATPSTVQKPAFTLSASSQGRFHAYLPALALSHLSEQCARTVPKEARTTYRTKSNAVDPRG